MLPRSQFARNILTVAGGTVVAQAVPVLASPLLTRLYEPAEFGLLALYLSLVAVGAIASTGRYELAILIPAEHEEARALAHLSMLVALAFSIVVAGVALLLWLGIITIGAWEPMGGLMLLVPLGILATATYQSITYWLNRQAAYRTLAAGRIAQSGTMTGVQLGGGLLRPMAAGLVAGHLVGQLAGIVALMASKSMRTFAPLGRPDGAALRRVAAAHARFPKYLVIGHVANVLSSQLPVLLLAMLFSPAVAGLYALAERVLVLPSSLIGSAVGDVYRQRAAEEYQALGNCRALFVRTVRHLALLSALPCVAVMLMGPPLFAFVFGEAWRAAGEVAAILAGMVFFQMVSSPLSQTVLLAGMQRLDMAWQLLRLVVASAALYLGTTFGADYRTAILFYALGFAAMHVLHSLMQYHAARGTSRRPAT